MARDDIARRVDELREERQGPDFVEAVRALSESLPLEEQELLGEILLERADTEYALRERIDARGWLRRQLGRADWRR